MPIVAKLDELGKPAWIALMILGFVDLVAGRSCHLGLHHRERTNELLERRSDEPLAAEQPIRCVSAGTWWQPSRSSGNRAFDEYREETLRRLEEEQREFHDFLGRLRMAKDKAEFDQFMAERRARTGLSRRAPPVIAAAELNFAFARAIARAVHSSGGRPVCIWEIPSITCRDSRGYASGASPVTGD